MMALGNTASSLQMTSDAFLSCLLVYVYQQSSFF